MNVITILLDSLNFHCLEPYGADHVRTPNMARLAERSVTFDNHFIGSAPCMPARRELFTGRQEFLWRGWGYIEPWDRHLASDANGCGYVTQMITDHYHYWENSAHGYFEPFHGVEFIRGHELDMWDTSPLTDVPEWAESINKYRKHHWSRQEGWGSMYYSNARNFMQDESLFPCAQVMQKSADWLSKNCSHDKFFLWTEAFDPHEPHYLPEKYRVMYSPDGKDHPEFTCWPPYQNHHETATFLAGASDMELAWIQAQYYGKVTMTDHWLGHFLDRMDALNMWENTVLILTTDHGHELCADRSLQNCYAKGYPHREAHSRIPLMIYHPDAVAGKRVNAITTAVDVSATVRDICGSPECDGPDGRSLLPLTLGESDTHREYTLFGDFGTGACIATDEWILSQGSSADGELNWYSTTSLHASPDMTSGKFIPGVDIPQWKIAVKNRENPCYLWRRRPFSQNPENLIDKEPVKAAEMRDLLKKALNEITCPPETFKRLGLPD